MLGGRRILAGALLAASVELAACGGAQSRDASSARFEPRLPAELTLPETATRELALAARGNSLDERVAAVIEDLDQRGIVAFAPGLDDDGGVLDGFARYVAFTEDVEPHNVRHTVFVTFGPWSADRERAFIRTFWPLPSRLASGDPPPMLHWVGDVPPPPTIDYLFGGHWWGALESAMLEALSTLPDDEAGIAALDGQLRATFAHFGMPSVPGDGGDSLAAIFAAIPKRVDAMRPPAATLVAAGLLLGHELTLRDPGLRWFVVDDDSTATFYALAVDGDPATVLRPIDFMLQAWEAGVTDPVHGYLELATEHVAAHRMPPEGEGSE